MHNEATRDITLFALLKKAELFSNLLDDDLAYVASRTSVVACAEGAYVFRPGEKAKCFYIVKRGEIIVTRPDDDGHEELLARYVEGDVIGDFDFAINGAFDSNAKASCQSELVVFPGGSLKIDDLAKEKPDATARILLRSVAMIASRLRSTQKLISENAPWVRELRRQIFIDSATGLLSKAFLDEEIPKRLVEPTAIILLKPDKFKELNDANGHSAGDAAMSKIAIILNEESEQNKKGWALRLRSNETAFVIPRCSYGEVEAIAKRLTEKIAAMDISKAINGAQFSFTASVAYAVWPNDNPDWKNLVERLYEFLTKAWRDGGDRIYKYIALTEARR